MASQVSGALAVSRGGGKRALPGPKPDRLSGNHAASRREEAGATEQRGALRDGWQRAARAGANAAKDEVERRRTLIPPATTVPCLVPAAFAQSGAGTGSIENVVQDQGGRRDSRRCHGGAQRCHLPGTPGPRRRIAPLHCFRPGPRRIRGDFREYRFCHAPAHCLTTHFASGIFPAVRLFLSVPSIAILGTRGNTIGKNLRESRSGTVGEPPEGPLSMPDDPKAIPAFRLKGCGVSFFLL